MRWEQPETRPGRTAVLLLVVAILVATALAIALVVGGASRSPLGAGASLAVPQIQLDTAVSEGVAPSALDIGPGRRPGTAGPGGVDDVVIVRHRTTSAGSSARIGALAPGA